MRTRVGAGLACTTNSPVVTSLANRLLGDTSSSRSSRPVHASQAGTDVALADGNHSWQDYSAVDWVWHQSRSTERLGADSPSQLQAAKGTAWVPLAAKGRNNASLQVKMNNRTGNWADLGTGHGAVTAATLEVQFHYGRCNAFGPESDDGMIPDGGDFAYAVIPEVTRSDLSRLCSSDVHSRPWTILSNTVALQAVAWYQTSNISTGGGTQTAVIQSVFWKQGTLAPTTETLGLSAPSGLLVMSKLDGSTGSLALTVSDPWGTTTGAATTTITVTGKFAFFGKNCSSVPLGTDQASSAKSTNFVFGTLGSDNQQGRSATVVCSQAPRQ